MKIVSATAELLIPCLKNVANHSMEWWIPDLFCRVPKHLCTNHIDIYYLKVQYTRRACDRFYQSEVLANLKYYFKVDLSVIVINLKP